jgi:SAM-dependent methyltransferase
MDVVLASGSLHHTGDARRGFLELERVLAPGGIAYISLYRAESYYERAYRTVGALARVSARRRIADAVVNRWVLLPLFALYFWLGRAIVHRKVALPSYRHLVNYFADQFLNPVVSFHSEAEVHSWADELGMEVVSLSVSHAGALLNVAFCKRPV